MEEGRDQRELFGEYEKPKKRFIGLARLFPKADFSGIDFAFTLKLDKLIFISIAIIMLMVIVYAIGVETGKSVTVGKKTETLAIKAPKPYSILVASYSRKDLALQEFNRLKRDGFSVSVYQSGTYYRIWVGSYESKDSEAAQMDLKKIKLTHKDAYLKMR